MSSDRHRSILQPFSGLALGAHHEGGDARGLDLHRLLVPQLLDDQRRHPIDLPGAGPGLHGQLAALGVAEAHDEQRRARLRPGHGVARIPRRDLKGSEEIFGHQREKTDKKKGPQRRQKT